MGFVISPFQEEVALCVETSQHALKVFLEARGHFGKSCSLPKSNSTCISSMRKMCRHGKRLGGRGHTSDLPCGGNQAARSFLSAS